METRKETAEPTSRIPSSEPVKSNPNSRIFNRLAPNITGTARKNVNSAAVPLATPISSAPKIVAPERLVPGNTAAITWNTPISNAV